MKIDLTPQQFINAQNAVFAHKRYCADVAKLLRKARCPMSYRVARQDWAEARDLYRALTNQSKEETECPAN